VVAEPPPPPKKNLPKGHNHRPFNLYINSPNLVILVSSKFPFPFSSFSFGSTRTVIPGINFCFHTLRLIGVDTRPVFIGPDRACKIWAPVGLELLRAWGLDCGLSPKTRPLRARSFCLCSKSKSPTRPWFLKQILEPTEKFAPTIKFALI
jgi:hypothetical protein